jgi:hypothetical protein
MDDKVEARQHRFEDEIEMKCRTFAQWNVRGAMRKNKEKTRTLIKSEDDLDDSSV